MEAGSPGTAFCGMVTTIFLGGWLLPFGIDPPTWVDPLVVLGAHWTSPPGMLRAASGESESPGE